MRRLEKDRIQAGMVLPIDRLVEGPQAVRRLTKQFSVRNKKPRSSYLDDGDDLEIPSLNGQHALPEGRLR